MVCPGAAIPSVMGILLGPCQNSPTIFKSSETDAFANLVAGKRKVFRDFESTITRCVRMGTCRTRERDCRHCRHGPRAGWWRVGPISFTLTLAVNTLVAVSKLTGLTKGPFPLRYSGKRIACASCQAMLCGDVVVDLLLIVGYVLNCSEHDIKAFLVVWEQKRRASAALISWSSIKESLDGNWETRW